MTPDQMQFSLVNTVMYTLFLFITAIVFSAGISRLPLIEKSTTLQSNRYGCIDGLRGLLAIGVFIHHSFVAYVFFTQGKWEWTASPIFNHLGQTSVALFFMITGFLFSTKLLYSKIFIDLISFYLGRIARLFPLYFITVLLVVLTVFIVTDWELRSPVATLAIEVSKWLSFVIFGRPDINAFVNTSKIIAGVNWTLKYEWIFYFCVPILFFPLRFLAIPTNFRLFLPVLLITLVIFGFTSKMIGGVTLCFLYFASGILVALIQFDSKLSEVVRRPFVHVFTIPAIVLLLILKDTNNFIAVLLTTYILLTVSGGFSFFGLLKRQSVLWLGDISYGIYLLHGLVLFWVLRTLSLEGLLGSMSALSYTILVMLVTCVVLFVASVSFIYIEKPAMELVRTRKKMFAPSI